MLVQDFGVARLARAVCPELPLHASTQMSLTSAEGMRVAESLGVRRIVLARELSIEQIRMIRGQTSLELEAFVRAVAGLGPLVVTAEDGVRALLVAEEALQAVRSHPSERTG